MSKKLISLTAILLVILTVVGCAKTPSGNSYSKSNKNFDDAVAAFESAWAKNDELDNIEYEIALLGGLPSNISDEKYGIKNVYKIKNRSSESAEIYTANTYYGTSYNLVNAYYHKDGYIYTELYDTFFASQITVPDFLEYTKTDSYYNDPDIFNASRFTSSVMYSLKGGGKEIVFTAASDELKAIVAKALGFDTSGYSYSVGDIQMTVLTNKSGLLTSVKMSFEITYGNVMNANSLTYVGDFSYTLLDTTDQIEVNKPSVAISYTFISSIYYVDYLFKGYEVLSTFTTLDAEYSRLIRNTDGISGSVYESENYVHMTEAYRDEVYTYGSIDREYISIPSSEKSSSAGVFVVGDKHYYRDTDGKSEDTDNTGSVLDWISMVFETLSSEMVLGEDITNIKVSETDSTITFTYSFNSETIPAYGAYLLGVFSDSVDGKLSSYYIVYSNTGSITVRKSDGCILSHTVHFAVAFGNILLENEYSMKINATGNDVRVLTLDDWSEHLENWNSAE